MCSDLKLLVGDVYTSGHCLYDHGLAKFRDDTRERKVTVSRELYVTHDVKILVFQGIPRKISWKIRDSSVIVATRENASSIGRSPCPGNREL